MPTINEENLKQIRTPFNVFCTFMSREDNTLTDNITSTSELKAYDLNYTAMLQDTSVNMRVLADLANGGFTADGTAEFDDGIRTGSQAAGKLGLRTNIGESVKVDITGEKVINSLTITTSEGEGEILDLNSFHSVGTNNTKAYTKQVPTGANYTRVNKILGESVVSKNVIPLPTSGTITKNGITVSSNPDGSVNVSGTATATLYAYFNDGLWNKTEANALPIPLNGTYTLSGGIDNSLRFRVYNLTTSSFVINTNGSFTVDGSGQYKLCLFVASGTTVNTTLYPQIEKGTTATKFLPYGLLIDATPTNVTSSNGQSLSVNYGTLRSCGNVHDELDLANGKIIRRVGQVDLSTLNYTRVADYSHVIYRASIPDRIAGSPNTLCSSYERWTNPSGAEYQSAFGNNAPNMSYAPNTSTGTPTTDLYFRNDACTTSSAFKQAMQGVMLNYELAEPYEEPIQVASNLLEVEPNGSTTFESVADTYGLQVPLTSYVDFGTIKSYAIKRINVIPVNASSISLRFIARNDTRLSISSITAGLTLEFDNDNLISCVLALRSNLNIIDPSWAVSEIELKAYYPDDIAAAIGNVGDNVPIMYYSGYEGDYSTPRTFYMSQKAAMENNIVTIKGEDASSRLEDYDVNAAVMISPNNQSKTNIYDKLKTVVQNGLGSGVTITTEAAPPISGLDAVQNIIVFKDNTANHITAQIMNIGHKNGFYPAFIDAGIPTIKWSMPTSQWDIYEEDCANVVEEYDRNINKIMADGEEYAIQTRLTLGARQTIDTVDAEPGQIQSYDFNGFVYSPSVSNARSVIQATASRIVWVGGVDGSCVITGQPCNITTISDEVTAPRLGVTETLSVNTHGQIYDETKALLYPNYASLFEVSNLSGSFTFKGDPRMQPRDVFTFHRLNGNAELCTIETITINHENGGTFADITYRKGVV